MRLLTAFKGPAASEPSSATEFAAWVQPHLIPMARLAALAPAADRDDVIQNSLARAWFMRARYDPRRGTPAAWLLAITSDQARQANRRRPLSPLVGEVPARVNILDDRIDIEQAIARLPTRQRLAIDCYYFAGLSISETSAVMACSVGTVKSTLFDARERLRPLLEVSDDRR